jgi:hypothetical protein
MLKKPQNPASQVHAVLGGNYANYKAPNTIARINVKALSRMTWN